MSSTLSIGPAATPASSRRQIAVFNETVAVQSDIAASIKSSCSTLPELFCKRVSEARSSRSIFLMSLSNIEFVFAPIIINFLSLHR